MSAIRDRLLAGDPNAMVATSEEFCDWLVESIESWTDEERRLCREHMDAGLKKWQSEQDAKLLAMPCSPRIN
jgi:hypothetical protein